MFHGRKSWNMNSNDGLSVRSLAISGSKSETLYECLGFAAWPVTKSQPEERLLNKQWRKCTNARAHRTENEQVINYFNSMQYQAW